MAGQRMTDVELAAKPRLRWISVDYRCSDVNPTVVDRFHSYGVPLPTILQFLYSVYLHVGDQAVKRGLLIIPAGLVYFP